MISLLTTAGLAFIASFCLTPLVGRAARRLGIVDRPDKHRKLHVRAVPLCGGVAVLAGAVCAVVCQLLFSDVWGDQLRGDVLFLTGLLLSTVVVCGTGLVDDSVGLDGRKKLAGQFAAAGILVASGLLIRSVHVVGWDIELGLLAVPFTLLWLLGTTNALNLIDGMDGLAASVGIVLSLCVSCVCLLTGHMTDAVLAMAVAGSLAGFLCHNFPPAGIFLGDTGSMLIGLVVGALAVRSSLKGSATLALAIPVAVWAIPMCDVCVAILRRKLTGRSIYEADRGHLHHRLQQCGYNGRETLAWIVIFCACTGTGAIIGVRYQNELLAVGVAAAVIATLIAVRIFGHTESLLLYRRLKTLMGSFLPSRAEESAEQHQVVIRLQGDRPWESLWQTLIDFAERCELNAVELDINIPALHESYHGRWQRARPLVTGHPWKTEIPLCVGGLRVGRLRMSGPMREGSASAWTTTLISGLSIFKADLSRLLADQSTGPELNRPDEPTTTASRLAG